MGDTDDMPGLVDLHVALEGLRNELQAAWEAGKNEHVRFRVSDITLTVEAVARREKEAGAKIRWWLVEGGAGGKRSGETTQTLVLTLSPGVYDKEGRKLPLDVYGEQLEPGK